MNSQPDSFPYLHNLLAFLADNPGTEPMSPWLASLDQPELDRLLALMDSHLMEGGPLPEECLSDLVGVIIRTVAAEKMPTNSFECSITEIEGYVFALGVLASCEHMRRQGLARILEPMRLTSDVIPQMELLRPADSGPDL